MAHSAANLSVYQRFLTDTTFKNAKNGEGLQVLRRFPPRQWVNTAPKNVTVFWPLMYFRSVFFVVL